MNQKELNIIKNADFSGNSREDEIYEEMQEIIRKKTDDFTNPAAISDVKIDMTETIKEYGYDVDNYITKFGSVNQSEEDCCKRMIDKINGNNKATTSTATTDADKAKRKRRIAIKLKLQLQLTEK